MIYNGLQKLRQHICYSSFSKKWNL